MLCDACFGGWFGQRVSGSGGQQAWQFGKIVGGHRQCELVTQGFSVGMLLSFLSFRQTFTDRANALVN
jgi:hypothetical protein